MAGGAGVSGASPYLTQPGGNRSGWWDGTPFGSQVNAINSGINNGSIQYDPTSRSYVKTPTYAGTQAGQFTSSYLNSSPQLQGLFNAGMSGVSGYGGSPYGVYPGGAGGYGGAGYPGGYQPGGISGGGYVGPIQAPNMTAANNAIFAQAKNQAGQTGRGALESLKGELGSSGMIGSGAQAQATRDVVNQAQGQLGAVTNQNAITNAQIGEQNALAGYQGNIAQRGQDIQAQEANAELALQANNAAWQRNMGLLGMAMTGLRSGAYGTPAPSQTGMYY